MPLTVHAIVFTGLCLIAATRAAEVCFQDKVDGLGQSAPNWAMLQRDKEIALQPVVMSDLGSLRETSEPVSASEIAAVTSDLWGPEELRDWSVASLAVVGNGPLSDGDRKEIKTYPAERVIRFNAMPNLAMEEPVGHLYANACSRGWWGVTSLACKRVMDAVEVVLFGEPEKARANLPEFNERFGNHVILGIGDGEHISINGKKFETHNVNGGFSIGFKGIAYARWRYPAATLQIFGFTWQAPPRNRGHPFNIEKQGVASMQNVVVHPAPYSQEWHGGPACEVKAVQALLQQDSGTNASEAWSLWAGEAFADEFSSH
mmetsp:Transcript_57348/g.105939  ORF Transcript_57348/g.105939 Transcript_57348/m.105939 type:complete len:317 (-) Transcript_57348:81-1031(-)